MMQSGLLDSKKKVGEKANSVAAAPGLVLCRALIYADSPLSPLPLFFLSGDIPIFLLPFSFLADADAQSCQVLLVGG